MSNAECTPPPQDFQDGGSHPIGHPLTIAVEGYVMLELSNSSLLVAFLYINAMYSPSSRKTDHIITIKMVRHISA